MHQIKLFTELLIYTNIFWVKIRMVMLNPTESNHTWLKLGVVIPDVNPSDQDYCLDSTQQELLELIQPHPTTFS